MRFRRWLATITGSRARRFNRLRTERRVKQRLQAEGELMARYIVAKSFAEAQRLLGVLMLLRCQGR
jgi:hypothetical protein